MLKSTDNPNLIKIDKLHTFFKTDFKSGYSFEGERHPWWEIVFVLGGSVGVLAGDKSYSLKRAQAIIHPPDEFHKIRSEGEESSTVIVLSFSAESFYKPRRRILSLTRDEISELLKIYEFSKGCFERHNINLTPSVSNTGIKLQKLYLRLELLIFSCLFKGKDAEAETEIKNLKGADIFNAAVRLMEENPGAGYTIADIAKLFSISSIYLKKLFLKYGGCGVMHYYNDIKIRLACSYLSEGKSVKETADILGFSDQNYFSTFFKKAIGISPTEYKSYGTMRTSSPKV